MKLNDILEALASAQGATEQLPQVQMELNKARRQLEDAQRLADSLRAQADANASIISEQQSKLARLEEERDDYGFRNLELTERLEKVAATLGLTLPPVEQKPEPTPAVQPEPVKELPAPVEAKPEPIADSSSYRQDEYKRQDEEHQRYHSWTPVPSNPTPAPEVASPPNPTLAEQASEAPSAAPETASTASSSSGETPAQSTPTDGASQPTDESRKYAGLSPYAKPTDISWPQWISGGGGKPSWMA